MYGLLGWAFQMLLTVCVRGLVKERPKKGLGVRQIQHRSSGRINTSEQHGFSRQTEWY